MKKFFCLIPLTLSLACACWALDQDASLMRQSIHTTKQSVARETLNAFYQDAQDLYREKRFNEALELLDKIRSIDPGYEDSLALRKSILKMKTNRESESTRDTVRDFMRKGDQAFRIGQSVLAISFWRQALTIDPSYAPARKKIEDVNHALAQKQFEAGYLHYHHGELEDALDSWSNAMALDPSYKQRGLLTLMSKVERSVRRDKASRLAQQAFDQYQQKDLEASLKSYQELLTLEPRHEEARRYAAKIKIQLGQSAFQAAREAQSKARYEEAIKAWGRSIQFGYEVVRAQKSIEETEALIKKLKEPKPRKLPKPKPQETTVDASSAPATAAAPAQPIDREGAMSHYRKGLAAVRAKDFHLAQEELDTAYQLDPSNERIYMARERARQEWAAASASGTPAP